MAEGLRPTDAAGVAEVVAWAAAEEVPLEIAGAGTRRSFGRPVEATHLVELDGLSRIELYEPAELVMSALAGTPLAEIEARLVEEHQQLAFEPPDLGVLLGGTGGRQTIGGLIACNLAGPRRIKAGAARDHLLGVQAVTGRGDAIKSGGRVMKNVTGYDLCKLLAGSHGTLAVMTEVTFKVLPTAETATTLVLASPEREVCLRALRLAMGSAADVSGAACLPPDATSRSAAAGAASNGNHLALLRVEGPAPSVHARGAMLKAELSTFGARLDELDAAATDALWREVRDVALLPAEGVVWRLSLPPSAAPALLGRIEAELTFAWLADWAGGLLWLAVAGDEALGDGGAAVIRGTIAEVGGHATLVRAPEELRRTVAVFQPQPAPLARLTARVKDSFDPKRILNRGRMYADL
jgi:glycolate oxidase FAD binding subunit